MGVRSRVTGALSRAMASVRPGLAGSAQDAPAAEPATARPESVTGPAAQRTVTQAPARKATATKAPARKASATQAPAMKAPEKRAAMAQPAADVGVPSAPDAHVWTDAELTGFRVALEAEIGRLHEELDMGEADLADLIADSGDGAGDDQADAGAKTFEREHEMSVNANTREMLEQAMRARRRIDAGTYGICESCATTIAAGRLRAFPRATLCLACKQAEERR
jgi:RNA polymerase-binding transcription factor DksA